MAVPPAPYFTPISPHELAHDDDDASRYSAASGSVTRAGQGMSVLYGGPEHGNQIGLGAQLRALLPRVSFVPGAGRVPGGGSAAAAVQPALSAQGAVKLTRAGVAPSEPTSAPAGMPGQLLPVLADSPGPSPTPCSSRTVSLLHGDAYSPAAASSSLMGDETDDGGERDTYKDPGGGEDPNAPAAEAEPQEQLAFAGAPRRGETLRLHDSQFDERYVRLAVRGADSVQVRAQAQAQAQAQAPTEIVSVGELPPAPPYRSYASTPPPCEDRTTATAMHISIPREIPSVSLSPQWRSRGWRQTLRQRARFRDSSPGAAGADLEAERTPPFAHYSPGGSLQPPTQSFLAFQNRKRAAARGEAYRQSRMSRGDRHQSQHQRKGAAAAGHGPYIHNWGMPTHWPQETTAPHRQHPYRYDPVNGSPRPDQRFASAYAGPGDGHGYARYSVNFNHPGQRPQGDDGRLPPSAFSPMTPSCRHTSGLPPGGRPRPPSSCDSDATPYGDGSGEGSLHSKSTARVSHAPNFEDLFFDLLFVANLAVYAEAQQLNSLGKVGGFLAYFCLLWWTWYSHSLFDVRFRTRPGIIKTYLVYYPQLLNRLVQVGIWVAFTTTGGQFVRLDFTSFSQIYALNRLSLALDYLIIVVDKARGVWRGSDVDGFAAPSVRLAVGAGVGAGFNGQPLPLGQAGDLERNSELYPETKRGDRMFKAHRPLVLAMMGKVPQADLARTGGLPAAVQNVTEKRRMERRLVLQCCLGPAIGLASTLVSAFIWYMSSHISAGLMDANVRRSRSAQNSMGRFAVWFGATLTEIVLLFFAEWKTDMISLRHTQICERLALFAIVIVGEGFSVIGSTLNTLSPGLEKKATSGDRHFVPSDGCDMDVVMQAGATVLVLCFSFVTYYRDAMLELRHSSSLTILGWSFLHVVYFAAAALMVVGLRRLICFHSTISAFTRFMQTPGFYLPDKPLYRNYTTSESVAELIHRARAHANLTGAPVNITAHALSQSNLTSTYLNLTASSPETHIFAIISVIEGFDGVSIPSVEQAVALVKAAAQLVKVDPGPSMQLQIPGMMNYVSMLKSVKFIEVFIREGLFQFKYVYIAGAVIYVADCFIKGIAVGRRNLKQKMPSLIIRFCTGVLLSLMQITYFHYTLIPSWAALNGGIPILAAVMCAETLAQLALNWYTHWREEVRARAGAVGKLEEEQRWAARK